MAVRQFIDSRGVLWTVWDVRPDHMAAVTKHESPAVDSSAGWLAFESATEKRRLPAPYPHEWPAYSHARLEALCRGAPAAPQRRAREPRDDAPQGDVAEQPPRP